MIDKKHIKILGLSSYIPNSSLLNTDELNKLTGKNTGNLVYYHAISQILDIFPIGTPWHENPENKFPDTKLLILPLANQLGKHVDLESFGNLIKKIKIPIVAIGLGYQCSEDELEISDLNQTTWDWFDEIIKHAPNENPNVSLRGNKTYDFISKKGSQNNCIVTGCPSNFINPDVNLGESISKKLIPKNPRFAVAAGNPNMLKFKKIESSLIKILNESNGLYIIQSPEPLIKLSREGLDNISSETEILLTYRNYFDMPDNQLLHWLREKSHVFYSVPEWMETLSRFDIVVGMRIHGVLLGIQTGIPSLCICIDSRTLELCQLMKIPHIKAEDYLNGISKEEIIDILKNWDWKGYDSTRKKLARTLKDFLNKNEISTAIYFNNITESE